jgi:hypothetical protein
MKKFFSRKTVQLVTPPTTLPTSVQIPWQRIALSVVGISVVMFTWRWATFHLYTLPVTSITAFTSITNNTLYTVAVLVVFFVTGKVFFDWKNSTVSQVVQEAQNITEERTERIVKPKEFDDPSIP